MDDLTGKYSESRVTDMSNDIERKFNRIIRDQAFYEADQDRSPIDWSVAFVWILILMMCISTLLVGGMMLYYLVTLTWGEVAELVSGSGS